MAKKPKKKTIPSPSTSSLRLITNPRKQTFVATALYFIITAILTYPLLFRMNSSVYGPYDHATTDLFGIVYQYFWWVSAALFKYHTSPLTNPLLAVPYGTDMSFTNFTGFADAPFTALFGFLFMRNFNILFNLVVAALGMFLLVRHITGNAGAGFIAGIIFAFCPNMLVRSYTTFDSTQVQWIPFYTLFILKFIDERTWKNAILIGVFLVCHILFAFAYYLVYLPVQTVVMLGALAAWQIRRQKRSVGDLLRAITTPGAMKAWLKLGTVLVAAIVVFAVYFTTIVGGGESMAVGMRTTEQLAELALSPTDYLAPHPRMALLKDGFKEFYWDQHRPGKNPDSFVAYIGYITLVLMVFGIRYGRGVEKWIFVAGSLVAFWSTLGPTLFGIPTPSGLIHSLYASFARRILIYKVFVQFGVAGLAGMGYAYLAARLKRQETATQLLTVLSLAIIVEYSLVPPALSVDLTEPPIIYQHVRDLPEESALIEVPVLRNNGYTYQGYLYYQTLHGKPLFNPHYGLSRVPDTVKPFYEQMKVPIEACEYANLSTLRYLGITHLIYHWHIGTNTVIFRSHSAPSLYNKDTPGLRLVFESTRDPAKLPFRGPFDYAFADLYEITAEPCPIAITFDNPSPYEQFPGVPEEDFLIRMGNLFTIGWASALFDTTRTFYYPLPNSDLIDRLARQGGTITFTNLSGEPVDFDLSFSVSSADSGRVLEVRWNGESLGKGEIGPVERRLTFESIRLGGGAQGTLTLFTDRDAYRYNIGTTSLPAHAVIRDVRARVKY
ncbi:hypothetical protein ACFL5H_01725 [Candidatus Latescibacterota bacterium]